MLRTARCAENYHRRFKQVRDGTQAKAKAHVHLLCVEFEEIDRLDEALSNYRETSELSRINRLAAKEPVTTDPEVFQLLQRSLDFNRQSNGAFDITVGPLMRAWGFFRGQGRYPTAAELEQARSRVGWQNIKLDAKSRTVRFLISGLELDLGGIGKGYAIDRAVSVLREAGVKSAFVDSGSSITIRHGSTRYCGKSRQERSER